ncbi:hypothetical protein ABIA30_005385 [Mycobacterium sp. MAA66]|uniref:DUF5666 domain-containing protein n=1 Tax=Mycobacterium sp. MAA66 TaxID=3156297 RepID=UPI0035185265
MPTTSRARRCAVATLAGFAALSLAACGSSSTPSPTSKAAGSSSPSSASPAPDNGDKGKDRVFGLVGSVTGGTVSVNGKDGQGTVDITPSTHIAQFTPGQLTDITAGQCVIVHPTKDNDNGPAVTAADVLFGQPDNTQCGHKGGTQGRGVGGTVASVNGNAIVVTAPDNSQTTVTVTPDTHYTKRASADASAIAAGVCLGARGTKDGNGVLQATMAMVRPAVNGACGGGHQHN